ncbi:MAG: transposase [Acidobacteria bacterium]|nr:transposase [Acidobacteriota bacterium]
MKHDLFDLYTDYLISSFGPTTATGLARLLEGAVSHDQVTRFLAEPPKNSADLWRVVKPLVRHIQQPAGVLSIDDSLSEKAHTDENDLICWHWSHSLERHVKGIEFLTAFYTVGEVSLPIAFDLVEKTEPYVDPKTGKQKRRSPISKNARYRMLLGRAVHNQVPFHYVLNDLWYASADNMKYLKRDLKKEFIMPLKSNRKVALSEADKRRGQYVAVSTLDLPEHTTREIWLEDVPFAVLLLKQVFTNDDGSQGVRYLVTSNLTLTSDQITKLFHKRWGSEVYHKSLKQNASLAKSPTRTETTQRNHLFASLCAYVKLERFKLKTKLSHFTLKTKLYQAALQTAYAELVKLKEQLATA